jgi:glutamyl-tRNA synthetase
LYNFATVVDDAAMQITHIIRAKEHLSNTAPQVLAYEALGVTPPVFAHVPVVNAPNSSKKLSKRDAHKFVTPEVIALLRAVHAVPADWSDEQIRKNESLNPVMVEFYRVMGYLPEALLNYFGRLGWSLDDKTEIMPLETMIANFGFERVNDSPASFDPDKLYWLAGEYMKQLPVAEKLEGSLPYLRRAGLIGDSLDAATRDKLAQIIEASKERIKLFTDVIGLAAPFLKADPDYDAKAVEKELRKPGVADTLRAFAVVVKAAEPFDPATLERVAQEFMTAKGLTAKHLIQPLRVSLIGVTVGFGLYETMALLGRAETLRRIEHGARLAAG